MFCSHRVYMFPVVICIGLGIASLKDLIALRADSPLQDGGMQIKRRKIKWNNNLDRLVFKCICKWLGKSVVKRNVSKICLYTMSCGFIVIQYGNDVCLVFGIRNGSWLKLAEEDLLFTSFRIGYYCFFFLGRAR